MKNPKVLIAIVSIFLFVLFSVRAEEKVFDIPKLGSLKILVPENWEDVRDLFGMPLTLLGPDKGENRPVVVISGSEFKEFSLEEEALKKSEEEYKKGRLEWLRKYNGKVVEFFPYKHSSSLHQMGFRYELNKKEFTERSYYIFCEKKIFHLKTLLLTKDVPSYEKNLNSIIESFSCKKGSL